MKPTGGEPTHAGDLGPAPAAVGSLVEEDRRVLLERFATVLATDGVVRGLIGPREVPRLWDRHLLNSALLASALPQDGTVADVGSGAGLPGVVLAIVRADCRVMLIEPLLRRTTFLEEVVALLALDNVTVRRDRAEAVHGETTFDVVTARAVAPLDRLLGWCMPLVAPTGELLAMKGSSAHSEIAAARSTLARLECAEPCVEELSSADRAVSTTRVVRVTWADPARVSWRSSGGRGGQRPRSSRPRRKMR